MVIPTHNSSSSSWSQRRSGGGPSTKISVAKLLTIIGTAIPSFFLGTLVSLFAGINQNQSREGIAAEDCSQKLDEMARKMEANCKQREGANSDNTAAAAGGGTSSGAQLFPSEGFGHHLVGMSTVDKQDFINLIDPGVPIDPPSNGANDVLMLYTSSKALPKTKSITKTGDNPKIPMADAIENCNQVNVVLNDHSGFRKQCIAIVPQYESYHIQKWMRVSSEKNADLSKLPLQLVSRGALETGRDAFKPPKESDSRQHWELLQTFLKNFDDVLADLKPILEKIAKNKTVIVMVCNFGQSELITNFVCASRTRNLDISNVIVFAADTETKELAEGLGLTAYYDHRVSFYFNHTC